MRDVLNINDFQREQHEKEDYAKYEEIKNHIENLAIYETNV